MALIGVHRENRKEMEKEKKTKNRMKRQRNVQKLKTNENTIEPINAQQWGKIEAGTETETEAEIEREERAKFSLCI